MTKRYIERERDLASLRSFMNGRYGKGGGLRRALLLFLLMATACTGQSAKNRFLLAEQLWHEGKYQASVSEYEKVMQKEEGTDLALQAAYRAGMTETLFLKEHVDAIRKFNRVIDLKRNSPLAHEASRQIGEILYSRLEQHEQAVTHYGKMIEVYPSDSEVPEWLFRIGKSQFHLLKFDDSVETYRKLLQTHPKSAAAERAHFEIGVSFETKAHQKDRAEGNSAPTFKEAIAQFETFIRTYPQSKFVTQAKFEIAGCYEELGLLDQARQAYEGVKASYPLPHVVTSRLRRLEQKKPKKTL